MTPELLSCPFCGGEPLARDGMGEFWIRCENCGASTVLRGGASHAVADWNRRSEAKPIEVEEVAEIIDPSAFKMWQSQHDYCVRAGDSEEEATATADWAYRAPMDAATTKAQAILSKLQGGEGGTSGGRLPASPDGLTEGLRSAGFAEQTETAAQTTYRLGYQDGYVDGRFPEGYDGDDEREVYRDIDGCAMADGWSNIRDTALSQFPAPPAESPPLGSEPPCDEGKETRDEPLSPKATP